MMFLRVQAFWTVALAEQKSYNGANNSGAQYQKPYISITFQLDSFIAFFYYSQTVHWKMHDIVLLCIIGFRTNGECGV